MVNFGKKCLCLKLYIYFGLKVLRKAISILFVISTGWNNYKNNYVLSYLYSSIEKL